MKSQGKSSKRQGQVSPRSGASQGCENSIKANDGNAFSQNEEETLENVYIDRKKNDAPYRTTAWTQEVEQRKEQLPSHTSDVVANGQL